MRRPLNALRTTSRTRSASVPIGIFSASYTFLAAETSRCAVGGFTLMMCAPSWHAICAAYALTSTAVSPSFEMPEPRGYDHTTTARPFRFASSVRSRICRYISLRNAEAG